MKKLLGIIVLGLLCFNVSIANIEEGKIHLMCKVLNSSDIAGLPLNYEKELGDIKEKISIKTRQYAKRQSTWARGNMMSWIKIQPKELNKFLKKI